MSQKKSCGVRWLIFGTSALLSLLAAFSVSGVRRAGAAGGAVAALMAPPAAPLPSGVLQGGSWSSVIQTTDVPPVHISLLPDGRLLYWGRDKAVQDQGSNVNPDGSIKYPYDNWDVQFRSRTYLWNPLYSYDPAGGNATPYDEGATLKIENTTTNLFCSGHSFLPDGTLLVAGGHQRHPDPNKANLEGIGEDDLNTFDYRAPGWNLLATHMQHGRWYPRNLTLADGRTLVMSGTYLPNPISNASLNTVPEIFGLDGTLTPTATDLQPPSYITSTYPFLALAPDAKVYYAGAPDDASARFLDLVANAWARTQKNMDAHDTGTAVTYAPGRMMVVGGRHPVIVNDSLKTVASNRAQLMNLNQASGNSTPDWAEAQAMQNPRVQISGSVLLPDGKLLVAGGTRCPATNAIKYNLNGEDPDLPPCDNGQVLTPELWTPGDSVNPAGSWAAMSPMQETRVYHSTALLLPDGRVLVAGGGLPAASGETANGLPCTGANEGNFLCKHYGHKTAEIFSPPYLFEPDGAGGARPAVRPDITYAPASAAYGQQFFVGVGNVAATTANISKVVLVRLPSITHGTDPDQRRVELSFQPSGDGLNVTAPSGGAVCPPGPYMLFLIRNNGRGTPSFAKVIRIGDVSVNRTSLVFQSGLRNTPGSTVDSMSNSVSVSAPPGVNWTASLSPDAASWLTVTSGLSGAGSGTINLNASVNSTGVRRGGTLTVRIAGRNYANFQVKLGQAADFSDVSQSHPFYAFIGNFYAREFTGGCGSNVFCPESSITRGQAAVFLTGAMGLVPALHTPKLPTFTDVAQTHPFYKFIEAAARGGVMSGCAPGQFCSETPITRGEMAVAVIKSLGVTDPPAPATPSFSDVPPSSPQYRYIEEMYRRGITSGCASGRYCPDSTLTRGQAAVFISLAFKLWPQTP